MAPDTRLAALTGAPVEMVVQPLWQTGLTVSQFGIALAITAWIALRSEPGHRATNLFLLAAGAGSFLLEALADAMLLIWHPVHGQWTIFSAFGHHVPVWVSGVFWWAFGGQAVWMLALLRRGASAAELWKLYAFFAFTDLLFEMPPLWFDVYRYYGEQPLVWLPWIPLPMYLPFGNALVPVFAALVAWWVERSAWPRWTVAPLALTAMFAAITVYGWPVALTLNSEAGTALRWGGGLASIALSLLVMQIVARQAGRARAPLILPSTST